MKRNKSALLLLQMVVILVCCARSALAGGTITSPPPKDLTEAHQWFQRGLEEAYATDVQFNDTSNHIAQPSYVSYVTRDGDHEIMVPTFVSEVSFGMKKETGEFLVHFSEEGQADGMWVGSNSRDDAEHFCQALLYMVRQAQKDWDTDVARLLTEFKPKADAWRAAKVKPERSADAKAHQTAAEKAYRDEKILPKAVAEYRMVVVADPFWPEAELRCAELAGEQGLFRIAVVHMQRYLLLVPDSPEAKKLNKELAEWKAQETYP